MAKFKKISRLDDVTSLDGTETLPVVQSSTTKKATVKDIRSIKLTDAESSASVTPVNLLHEEGVFDRYGTNTTPGTTDMTTAITNAVKVAVASGGTAKGLPGSTYLVDFSSTSSLIEITGEVTIDGQGCTIKASRSGDEPTNAQERELGVFHADGVDNITIKNVVYDGQRGAASNPYARFATLYGCRNVTVTKCRFEDVDNYVGVVRCTAYNGSTVRQQKNIRIENNTVIGCASGFNIEGPQLNTVYSHNIGRALDLIDPNDGEDRRGSTLFWGWFCRVVGFVNGETSSSDGLVDGVTFTGNLLDGASNSYVCWNQDATVGLNPESFRNVTFSGNYGNVLFGIEANSADTVSITGNTCDRLALDSTAMGDYEGTSYITDTSGSHGAGIEARPGTNFTVVGNAIDGKYDPDDATDLTNSSYGIVIGVTTKEVDCTAVVEGNTVKNCFIGIGAGFCQDSLIAKNRIEGCSRPIRFDTGTASKAHERITIEANTIMALPATDSPGSAIAVLGDDITVALNKIFGDSSSPPTGAQISHLGATGVNFQCRYNQIKQAAGQLITTSALSSRIVGNTLDAGASSSTTGAIVVNMQDNQTVFFDLNEIIDFDAAVQFNGDAPTGATYTAGKFTLESTTKLAKGTNAQSIAADGGYWTNAPTAGQWGAGSRVWDISPSAGGTVGWVCVTSGAPGTWKAFGDIAA